MLAPSDRRAIEKTLSGIRNNYRSFSLHYPRSEDDCPDCGFDELTQSALDPACPTCEGTGKVLSWVTIVAFGRLQYYDFVTLSVTGIAPGIEIGDVVCYISTSVKDAVLALRASPYGYAYIDGDTFRPFSVQPTGVGHSDEWRVEWKRSKVDARATGY